jgi:ubiquinone/menaquinone biosynthesis C-methylase UbiE
VANALELPFANNHFDAVWTQHAQMNIESKPALYSELVRVLKPGGLLIYHDIFKGEYPEIIYPTPWSEDGAISYLIDHNELVTILQGQNMKEILLQDETEFAIKFFKELLESFLEKGTKPLGLHLVMGADAPIKIRNLLQNLTAGSLQVHQAVFRRFSTLT